MNELCRIPWWELSDEGVAKSAVEVREARAEAATSRELLLEVLASSSARDAARWLTLEAWGGLLGAARRNALCVQLAHPLRDFVPALAQWHAYTATPKQARAVAPLLEALPEPLPEPLWTAIYPTISCFNHSCRPNTEVRFLHDDHRGTAVATRRIARGEEVCISYIDDNERSRVDERRDSLRDYGFECDCEKCMAELSWRRRLRKRAWAE